MDKVRIDVLYGWACERPGYCFIPTSSKPTPIVKNPWWIRFLLWAKIITPKVAK